MVSSETSDKKRKAPDRTEALSFVDYVREAVGFLRRYGDEAIEDK